jgi:Mg2+/citrate symporter
MEFLKNFFINLAVLIGIGIVLFVLYPDVMRQMLEVYSALFGPIAMLILIVAALPRRKRSRR